jgi:hypothetical protein
MDGMKKREDVKVVEDLLELFYSVRNMLDRLGFVGAQKKQGAVLRAEKWLAIQEELTEIKNTQQEESAFWTCSKCSKLVFRDRVRCSFCDATRAFPCPECQSEMPGHHANYCSLYRRG